MISNGGRIKIKYHKLGKTEIREECGIVLDRYFLGLELGSVYNADIEGKPIGKLEYSLQGSAIFGANPIDSGIVGGGMLEGSALIRYTSMRFPTEFSQDSLASLGNIVESKIQLAWSPAQREWETSTFSFISCLLAKTNNLNDSSDIKLYPGFGLGINVKIPAFNEKRPKEEFGRSTGFFSLYYAYDSFWKGYEDRIVSDFRIDVFRILSNSITFSINGKLDASYKFEGPSDIRLSILGAINVSTISGIISGGK